MSPRGRKQPTYGVIVRFEKTLAFECLLIATEPMKLRVECNWTRSIEQDPDQTDPLPEGIDELEEPS